MCHQYGISTLVSPMSFGRENGGSECQLFSQAILYCLYELLMSLRIKSQTLLIWTLMLVEKLCRLNLPIRVINWIRDFLSNRSQRIKLSEGCYSEWGSAPSGVPQGTKLGPWPFLVLINDLDVVNLHV